MRPRSTRDLLLALALALPAGACAGAPQKKEAPVVRPAPTARCAVRGAGATAQRLRDVEVALARCEVGLARTFERTPPRLVVIAYGDRRSFVRGLQSELGFDEKSASFFARSSAPRPLRGKLLVPPDQTAVNICHELVHHYLEGHTDRGRLLAEKWFDEGSASFLAASVMEPRRVRGQLGWFASRQRYLPFYLLRAARHWSELHADPRLRDLAYLQSMSLASELFAEGAATFRTILSRSRAVPLAQAFRAARGQTVEDFVARWLDRTRADWSGRLFDARPHRAPFLPRATPEEVGLDGAAVRRLVEGAIRSRSDTLIVIKDGKLVAERHFLDARGPIETMSVTKSFVSLAIGLLLAEGKIPSVDTPLHAWFPEWQGTGRAKVTLRHVLTHTSGLEHAAAAGLISRQIDRTRYARERPLVEEPGRRQSYNNEACQLLSEVVHRAAGVPLDRFLADRLFKPLGIDEWSWEHDRAGNVLAYYGLALSARDLARIGVLLADAGKHRGRQLLPEAWVRASTSAGLPAFPTVGYLWWLRHAGSTWTQTAERLTRLQREGLQLARRLRDLSGRRFDRASAYWLEAGALLAQRERAELSRWIAAGKEAPVVEIPTDAIGFNANGWMGQYLAVYPRWRLVVVRQRQAISFTEEENQRHGFWNFFSLVERLAPRPPVTGRVRANLTRWFHPNSGPSAHPAPLSVPYSLHLVRSGALSDTSSMD